MKKHLLFIFTALLPLLASAQTVEIEGIWYVLTAGTGQAEVTRNPDRTTTYTGEVTIPSTVTNGGVEYSVTSIGDQAFRGSIDLTAVTIPASVTSLGSSAFFGCSGLATIELPSGLTGSIGNYAFYECSELTAITIPENVSSIGQSAFNGCKKLASVTLPKSMESIGTYAFRECDALISIVIPEGVTSIGESTFHSCNALTSITVPASVTSFGSDAFRDCKALTDVYISSVEAWCNISVGSKNATPLQYATNLYLNGTPVTELAIPGTVTAVKDYAFYMLNGLTSVTLSEGVTSVGEFAFRDCADLETLTLPTSVASIGASAFNGCKKLASITCKAVTPPTCGSNAFVFVEKSIPLYVPTSAIAAYQAAEGWMDFTNMQAMPEVTVTGITLDQATATLTEGETLTLTATVTPDDATDKTVVWSTSDAEVATVDENGVVTAVAEGTATITATAGGKEAACVVTVSGDTTGIELTEAQGSSVIYDLQGRRVEKATKGIYIVNGKKVVIK